MLRSVAFFSPPKTFSNKIFQIPRGITTSTFFKRSTWESTSNATTNRLLLTWTFPDPLHLLISIITPSLLQGKIIDCTKHLQTQTSLAKALRHHHGNLCYPTICFRWPDRFEAVQWARPQGCAFNGGRVTMRRTVKSAPTSIWYITFLLLLPSTS